MPAASQDALIAALSMPIADVTALTVREIALVAYTDVLTRTPWAIGPRDIAALRDAGCDDLAIHDACAVVAYFAFVNRVADGLGVELEGETATGT